jgi:tetratricopeptide (TPR) repeat protein
MAKADLLKGDYKGTIRQLAGVFEPAKSSSKLDGTYASIFLVRGTAKAISGDEFGAIEDFRSCQRLSRKLYDRFSGEDDTSSDSYKKIKKLKANEMLDTESRCIAGEGRVLYEAGKFDQAEKVYDTISKYSFVYTDILFEQGWNAYAKGEFNRTLGKLVSYNSPSLKFVLNSEVDVLRAQTYLEMCLYKDANDIAKAYPQTYQRLAELIKSVTNSYGTNMGQYFEMGRRNSGQALHADDPVHRLFNRFVRSPYFQTTLAAEKALTEERSAIDRFVRGPGNEKFNTFLKMVNDWRRNQVRQLGGSFIRNSMNDHYEVLISDLEKMGFIRLEILSRAKKSLMDLDKPVDQKVLARSRGMKEPKRRGDQMYFDFNGEFWNDEIGDYVFALDSECGKKEFEGNPLQ